MSRDDRIADAGCEIDRDCNSGRDRDLHRGCDLARNRSHSSSKTVVHEIEPVFDERSRVLVLGTIPSPKSREAGFFYGNPRNRFWKVLAMLFDEPLAKSVDDRRDLLLRHRIALWDVLASCEIDGASDASIRNAQPNDLSRIFKIADIRVVFATGAKAAKLYERFCASAYDMPCTALPSTSPANARASLDDLVEAYRALLPYLGEVILGKR